MGFSMKKITYSLGESTNLQYFHNFFKVNLAFNACTSDGPVEKKNVNIKPAFSSPFLLGPF